MLAMPVNIEQILRDCRAKMDKSVEHYEKELRGLRTGRATTALIDYLKVDYYGNPTDLKALASISVPEPTQLMVKPFDPSVKTEIIKTIERADLGLNPQSEGQAIRINVPAPSRERRMQLVGQVKKMAEDSKIAIRNERRDAIKHIDMAMKDKAAGISEDDAKRKKDEIEAQTKKHIETLDQLCTKKSAEIEAV
ncbi:MAG TPA: ribosome recycling factor [Phycisphaerales bacterium]|nr:ribosome recycling factor [Phycisphaerales bacterium]